MRVGTWATLAVQIRYVLADDSGEDDEIYGAAGPNNVTTPTTREGGITVHYVTVGKEKNVFKVRSILDMTLLRCLSSRIAAK